MATSVIFGLIDRLLAVLPAGMPSGVEVIDGIGDFEDGDDFLMVGIDDIEAEGFGNAAESTHTWAGLGNKARDEEGSVSCYAEAWNGDGDPAAARARVKAIIAAVETTLRADPALGNTVAGLQWTRFGERVVFKQAQDSGGAGAAVYFQIAYRARL